ncbi:MAG: hypothetical protein HFG28_09515 [Eubacterium sp.]|nr:hypothetical protein [Eubacterium sp.]
MFDGLGIIGLFTAGKQIIKEKTEKEIPSSYWNNKDLIHKDKMNPDITPQQFMKNLENGKYYSPTVIPEKYEQQKPTIVDIKRYEHDVKKYSKGVADIEASRGGYSSIMSVDEAGFPCNVRDIERFKLDAEEYGQEIADGKAMDGLYCFVTKNRF